MKNWSTNTAILKKNPKKFTIWQIEQMVNFGLDNKKLNRADLLKYWDKLNIDPDKKKYLEILLHA